MSYTVFENTMARLLTDKKFLNAFQGDPSATLADLDLTQDEKLALREADPDQLSIAALSFRKKRDRHSSHGNVIQLFFRKWLKKT